VNTESVSLSKDTKVLETKKPAIVEAAIRLFSEKGIRATTMKRFKQDLEKKLHGVTGTKNRLKHAIIAFYAFAHREPLLYKFLILSSHYELRTLLPKTPKPLEVIVEIVREGIVSGELKQIELPFAGAMIAGAITKLSDFKRMGVLEKELDAYIDPVTDFLWDALKTRQTA